MQSKFQAKPHNKSAQLILKFDCSTTTATKPLSAITKPCPFPDELSGSLSFRQGTQCRGGICYLPTASVALSTNSRFLAQKRARNDKGGAWIEASRPNFH
jgi:hypothetical protein